MNKNFLLGNLLILTDDNNYKYFHQDGSYFTIDRESKICSCAWYLDRGICKHLIAACIKTTTNLPGLVFKLKVLFTRCRRKIPVYMSPMKHTETIIDTNLSNDDVQDNVLDIVSNNSIKTRLEDHVKPLAVKKKTIKSR